VRIEPHGRAAIGGQSGVVVAVPEADELGPPPHRRLRPAGLFAVVVGDQLVGVAAEVLAVIEQAPTPAGGRERAAVALRRVADQERATWWTSKRPRSKSSSQQ
jgi:hypothetical protein